jgi:hypothetical protein
MGDEENLSFRQESYPGANPNLEPYGWDFSPGDFAKEDPVGACPTDPAGLADIDQAVGRYAAWLADSYAIIKARRPYATVLIGGISSYQARCWLQKLGEAGAFRHADAIGYHPYPKYQNTPQDGAATIEEILDAMSLWDYALPIWITEYGFSTNNDSGGAVKNERIKADYLTEEFRLLAPFVQGPIIWYTARDYPTTSAGWVQQCPPHDCPGGIGGFGLFELRNGRLFIEPAYAAFAGPGQ